MNKIHYGYLKINLVLVKSAKTTELINKYKAYSRHGVKSCLKQLKSNGADPTQIKVVGHFLR